MPGARRGAWQGCKGARGDTHFLHLLHLLPGLHPDLIALHNAAQRGRNSTHRTPLHPSDRVAQRRATPECKSTAPLPLLGDRQFGQPLLGLPMKSGTTMVATAEPTPLWHWRLKNAPLGGSAMLLIDSFGGLPDKLTRNELRARWPEKAGRPNKGTVWR